METFTTPFKAGHICQWHNNMLKLFIVHRGTNICPSYTRVKISDFSTNNFKLCNHDVRQAYVQSASHLSQKVYIFQ